MSGGNDVADSAAELCMLIIGTLNTFLRDKSPGDVPGHVSISYDSGIAEVSFDVYVVWQKESGEGV